MPCFITAEGIDGTGKSSVLLETVNKLTKAGHDIVLTREPTDSWLGQAVKRGIKEGVSPFIEAFLFSADRAEHRKDIEKWLTEGRHVISDRYYDSTIAYQAARFEEESIVWDSPEKDAVNWLLSLNRPFAPRPDLTILFDAPPSVCLTRVDGRSHRTMYEREAFLERVRHYYKVLAEMDPERFTTVDATGPFEKVVPIVESYILGAFDRKGV